MAYEVWTVQHDERGYLQRTSLVATRGALGDARRVMIRHRDDEPNEHLGLYFYNNLTLHFYPGDMWMAYMVAPWERRAALVTA